MKIMLLKVLVLCAAVLLTVKAKAQNDYVVTSQKDTIRCKITKSVFGTVKYKSADMKKAEEMQLYIKEYYVAKDDILRRRISFGDEEYRFLTVFEDGKINLYQDIKQTTGSMMGANGMMTGTLVSYPVWYADKAGVDSLYKLEPSGILTRSSKSKERMTDLADLLKDNKVVYDKFIADNKFNFDAIRNIIHLYNTGMPFVEKEAVVQRAASPAGLTHRKGGPN